MTANHRSLEESDLALIEQVKQTPSLYDTRIPDFRIIHRKRQDWEMVATELAMTPTEARIRWTCLRDRYSRELKKLRMQPGNGEYGNSDFFRSMDFLRQFVRRRRERKSNVLKRREQCWDINNDDCSKVFTAKIESLSRMHSESQNQDNGNSFEDEQTTTSYEAKMGVTISESERYAEFDDDVSYEEYLDQPIDTNLPQPNVDFKQSNSTNKLQNNCNNTLPAFPLKQQNTQISEQNVQYLSFFNESEDDLFGKSIAAYMKQLSRCNKIKAKIEMFQIIAKYIELEESARTNKSTNTNSKI